MPQPLVNENNQQQYISGWKNIKKLLAPASRIRASDMFLLIPRMFDFQTMGWKKQDIRCYLWLWETLKDIL